MPDPIELRTDGPHNPDYTREVGNALAEAVRVLNYATLGDAPGLEYPGDAYTLLGALYTATERLPQLLDQTGRFLRARAATGTLGDDRGGVPAALTASAAASLSAAASYASDLTRVLHDAQNAIAGLYVKGDDDA